MKDWLPRKYTQFVEDNPPTIDPEPRRTPIFDSIFQAVDRASAVVAFRITERRSGLTSEEQRITWNLFWTAIIAGTILFILFH